MNLCLSNICWSGKQELFLNMCSENGVSFVEVAPTKIVPSIKNVDFSLIDNFMNKASEKGIKIISMQSLFYNTSLNIFLNEEDVFEHLKTIFQIAVRLNCEYLVFGSPRCRRVPVGMTSAEAELKFINFIKKVSNFLYKEGLNIVIGIEANPKHYGCNFITNFSQNISLLRKINRNNIVPHIDSACIELSGERFEDVYYKCKDIHQIDRIHLSAPFLEPVASGETLKYNKIVDQLKEDCYSGFLSIEMKGCSYEKILSSICFIRGLIGGGKSE